MEKYTGLNYKLERLARFFIRHRRIGVALQVLIAVLCVWAMSGLRLRDDPNTWPPRTRPLRASESAGYGHIWRWQFCKY